MSNSTQNRRQFIQTSGKAGMAIVAMPIMSSFVTNNLDITTYQQHPLPYAYNALEPFIDAMTMEIHYTKHAATYATNLKDACVAEKVDTTSLAFADLIKNISHYSPKMRNNAGGHYNHELFWQLMKPAPATAPSRTLADAITKTFGSFDAFKTAFSDAAKTRFGSGWAWLIVKDGKLEVSSTPNQDNPLMDVAEVKGTPILGADVWEHAYYLKYQNRRADYLAAFWNVVNWSVIADRLAATK